MLPADDQRSPAGGAAEHPAQPPRTVSDSLDEILIVEIVAVKRDVDKIIRDFFLKRPSKRAAELLVRRLRKLFDMLDEVYVPQARPARRAILKRVRDSARVAAIAVSDLSTQELSARERAEIHEELLELRHALGDILGVYGLPGR